MSKPGAKKAEATIQRILITQPRPETEKSPYFDLERKYPVKLDFCPFIKLEGIPAKDFRKQKVEIALHNGIIFTSRNAIDHFFRLVEEMKVVISPETKYFCITEAVALYLQKFILYRKRKVFFGADGSNKSMLEVIQKQKAQVKFLYVCSENQQDNEIVNGLKNIGCDFQLAFMYRSVPADVKTLLTQTAYDGICFFTPSGVLSLFENIPDFKQNGLVLGAFGNNTIKAMEDRGLQLQIKAPQPQAPSMVAALERYLALGKLRG
jgi:uroporphyrinogen-III synthase